MKKHTLIFGGNFFKAFFFQSALLAICIGAALSGCKREGTPEPSPIHTYNRCIDEQNVSTPIHPTTGQTFVIDSFEAALTRQLTDRCVGYQYALAVGPTIVRAKGWGWAQIPSEGNNRMSPCDRMQLASVSKLVTAIAVVKIMSMRSISPDWGIGNYLPDDWMPGEGIGDITFRQLLSHTSPIRSDSGSLNDLTFAGIKAIAERDAQPMTTGYQNVNYTLLKVLMYTMFYSTTGVTEEFVNNFYSNYLTSDIFEPAGIGAASFATRPGDINVHSYNYVGGAASGAGFNNSVQLFPYSGPIGVHLSAVELCKLLIGVSTPGVILSGAEMNTLYSNRFGFHNNLFFPSFPDPSTSGVGMANGTTLTTGVLSNNLGIQASLLINSNTASNMQASQILANAMAFAWR